ncbi:MAG: glycosyltransferase [Anaerolineales bacterium]
MKKLSILLLGTQISIGGAQKVLLDQALWFHEHGHKVTAMFMYDKEGLQGEWQAASPFPIISLKAFAGRGKGIQNVLPLLKGLFSLWKYLRSEKVDVIETFTHDSSMVALPVAWLARVPVRIATHHGVIEGISPWRERIHSWMVNHNIAQKLVAVSRKMYQAALREGVHSERVVTILNGIKPLPIENRSRLEVRKEAGMHVDDLLLIAVGRLVYAKAHEVLVASMPAVLQEFPNAKVEIYGEGVLRDDLLRQIQRLGLSNSVKLQGKSDNIARQLSNADVFILSSRSEGLPIALLEAMSAGLPCISTKVEGVDEVLMDGVHGLTVPIGDPNALSQAILQLLRDPDARSKMGAAARLHASEFYTVDRMCGQYLELMLDCLNENK